VKLLLDTHVLLWWLADDPRLGTDVRALIADPGHAVLVSAASIWEMAIKRALGKLAFDTDLVAVMAENRIVSLPITVEHALHAGALPRHHDDPFDRMLIAQARIEQASLVTHDAQFASYEVEILWA
jgi:PIN domain nuclease of toxin-antitoxin system